MDQVKCNSSKSLITGEDVTIRPMVDGDVTAAVDCFSDHYDVFDAPVSVAAFLRTYPEAFFVATIRTDENGDKTGEKVIGVCASPIGPQDIAFFGLYGLAPGYRSLGVGSRLFQRCLDYIGPVRSVGLFAVPEMRQKYMERGGFTIQEGVSMVNFVGVPSEKHFQAFHSLINETGPFDVQFLKSSKENSLLLEQIIEYDYKIHLERRETLLRNALPSEGYHTCVVLEKGAVQGYGCVRVHSRTGRLMIGPLYGNTVTVVRHIVAHLLGGQEFSKDQIITSGVIINAVDAQPDGLTLATEWAGLQEIERCERLWRGTALKANYQLIYGVFSLDFAL